MTTLTNKKINPAGDAFDMVNSINKVSRAGSLYGKLFAIKDMQIYLLEQEKVLKEQIEREENNEQNKTKPRVQKQNRKSYASTLGTRGHTRKTKL